MTAEKLIEIFSPKQTIDLILDTDTYNEIDDQFAIAYLLQYRDRLKIKGFTVAPFAPIHNKKVKDTAESIIASHKEIETVLNLAGAEDLKDKINDGCASFMIDEKTPVESDAVNFIIEASKEYSSENRLYIVAIGAITNVASALLKDETLKDRIAIVWLGGSAHGWWRNREFNMYQDYAAARVVLNSSAPFAQLPCQGVVSEFITTRHEMEYWLSNKNAVCDYLLNYSLSMIKHFVHSEAWGKCLWDVTAIGFLLNDNNRFMHTQIAKRRLPEYEGNKYEAQPLDLDMVYVCEIKRDVLMYDLFTKIGKK